MLNCLGEGEYSAVMKHFLQRFPPGADRFEGVSWRPAGGNGCPVLADSIAHMECKVDGGGVGCVCVCGRGYESALGQESACDASRKASYKPAAAAACSFPR